MNALKALAPISTSAKLAPRARAQQRWFAASPARTQAVISQLYAKHKGRVARNLERWGLPAADADEACHEVFVIALRRLPSYRGEAALSTWLIGIARKVAADQRRSARSRYECLTDVVPEHGEAERLDVKFERDEEVIRVREAVACLKPGPRAVLRRFALAEVPMDQVAREQQLPLQTAYARLYAGQAALRDTLAQC